MMNSKPKLKTMTRSEQHILLDCRRCLDPGFNTTSAVRKRAQSLLDKLIKEGKVDPNEIKL